MNRKGRRTWLGCLWLPEAQCLSNARSLARLEVGGAESDPPAGEVVKEESRKPAKMDSFQCGERVQGRHVASIRSDVELKLRFPEIVWVFFFD